MLSQKEQKNPQVIHILSDIYDSDKVNFVKSISNMIIVSGFGNTVILPKSVLAGSLKRSGSEIIPLQADAKNKKSLLARGVTRVEGKFEVKDLVEVCNLDGVRLGVGRSDISSKLLRKKIKEKNQNKESGETIINKPVIHRNHLFLE